MLQKLLIFISMFFFFSETLFGSHYDSHVPFHLDMAVCTICVIAGSFCIIWIVCSGIRPTKKGKLFYEGKLFFEYTILILKILSWKFGQNNCIVIISTKYKLNKLRLIFL